LDPFVFEDPQWKREIPRQHESRQSHERCYPHQYQSFRCGPAAVDPILMDAFAPTNRKNQQRRRKKRDTFQGDGFDFLAFPPQALRGEYKGRSPFKGTDGRKPCQTPSPSPTVASTCPKQKKTKDVDPFLELMFAGAPSDSHQHQERRIQEQRAAAKSVDDAPFQFFFPGAMTSGVPRQQHQQELQKRAFHQAILQKVLEEEQKKAKYASRRATCASWQQSQQDRSSQLYELSIQEFILKKMLGLEQSAMRKEGTSKPEEETRKMPTNESKKSERKVTFSTNGSTSAVYQLPQQFRDEATDQALVLSIDVAGFAMDDLNLQVDPIRRGTARLNLKAKRTNALGDTWELERTKTLNAEAYNMNAVEATCDDDILKINIPKKTQSTTSNVHIPIHATTTTKDEQEDKENDVEDTKESFMLADLFEAMAADVVHPKEATEDARTEFKEQGHYGENDEVPVPDSLEDMLRTMVNQFERAYHQGTETDANETTIESEETKEQVDKNIKEEQVTAGIESKQVKMPVESVSTPIVAVKSERREKVRESTPDNLEEKPMKSSLNEESTLTAAGTMEKAGKDDDLFAPETETVFEPIKSTAEDVPTDAVIDNKLHSMLGKESHTKKNSDELVEINENAEQIDQDPSNHMGEDSSFDILDSEEIEDHQSWEDVDGNEHKAETTDLSD